MDSRITSLLLSAMKSAGAIAVLVILIAIGSRLALHPLRKFPGPFVARLSGAYSAIYIWRRDFHLFAVGLHEKYGSVVRVAPNRLLFSSATAVQDIYNNPRAIKGKAYIQLRQDIHGTPNLLNVLDKTQARQKRQIIGPVVSDRSMRIFEPEMQQQIHSFLSQLLHSSHAKKMVNMSSRCERLGVDIIGSLAFGYQLNTQVEPTHRGVVGGIKARGANVSFYYFWARLRSLDWLFRRIGGATQNLEGLHASVRTMVAARMAVPRDAKHDFYALASADKDHGQGLMSSDFWAEALLFIAAGGSTVATAMSGTFFYLSHNPQAYERLAAEIRSTFASGSDIRQGPLLSNCNYLRAVINETMRMSPSTLAVAWREQEPSSIAAGETFIVDGHVIPPGTQVALSNYTLHHDPTLFPEPFTYRPERWLRPESQTAEQKEHLAAMRRAFVPFSTGDRSCVGKPMAYIEMSLAIAKTMWYFDFEKASGEAGKLGEGAPGRTDGRGRVDEFQLYEGVVVGHDGPNLVFTPRGDYCKELEESL